MLRWAILGTSFISETVAGAIKQSDGSTLRTVAGRHEGRLKAFADKYAIPHAVTDFEAAINDPKIDVVYIGLPSHLHAHYSLLAAAAGKAVLSEKSLTVDMKSARDLVGGLKQHNTFFVEGLMYLAHPLYGRVTELLTDGRLGTIRAINGFYAADIAAFVNPAGKGTLYNLGCYPASLLHLVIQSAFGDEIFAARTMAAHANRNANDGNICDTSVSVRFNNGVLATLHSSDTHGMSHGFTMMGSKGSLSFQTNPWLPVAGDNILLWQPYESEAKTIVVNDPHDAFYHQVKLVERCIAEGCTEATRPSPRHADSLAIMKLLTDWEAACRL
ncbi:MAG: Gfo/Idh/MocA family oxidoreductase [Kordiimonadaceae bacterium]|nr:Gfo/Idh/MocA family oxidoreductase [Kordiimonadaceae bacterium]MBO6569611.1 Gfo/Idh/MocA family oxidoreductase [Kordiimonadaceae bacterium]MBO6966146.1 Gfo/Idh/MocA family oxidoreductase [Kordiimonadaceae bacterium]